MPTQLRLARASVVGGLIAFLVGCSAPAATPSPVASSTPAATTTATPSPTAPAGSATASTWSLRFEEVATFPGLLLRVMAQTSHGFLAGGGCATTPSSPSGCPTAAIVRSTDGRSWTAATIEGGEGHAIRAIAETPLGLIAVGADFGDSPETTNGTLWRSGDGANWALVRPAFMQGFAPSRVVPLHERVLVFGSRDDFGTESLVYATSDLVEWSAGEGVPVSGKVAAEPGLVAIGDECYDVCLPPPPIHVRRSADGFEWIEDGPDNGLTRTGVQGPLAAWNGRAVVAHSVSGRGATPVTVWFDEPSGWRRTDLTDSTYPTVGRVHLVARDDDLVVIAFPYYDERPVRAWRSSDAITWQPIPIELPDGSLGAVTGRTDVVGILDENRLVFAER